MVVEKRNPIPVKEAIQRIVNQQSSMPAITVALEKSLNHILAEDIVATYDIPRFDKYLMMVLQFAVLIHKGQVVRIALSLK